MSGISYCLEVEVFSRAARLVAESSRLARTTALVLARNDLPRSGISLRLLSFSAVAAVHVALLIALTSLAARLTLPRGALTAPEDTTTRLDLIWLDPQSDPPATPDAEARPELIREWTPPRDLPPRLASIGQVVTSDDDQTTAVVASIQITDHPDPWLAWIAELRVNIDHAWEPAGDLTASYFACSITLVPRSIGNDTDERDDEIRVDGCTSQSAANTARRDSLLAQIREHLPLEPPRKVASAAYNARPIRLSFERGDPDNPPLDALN